MDKENLRKIDKKARKLIMMYKALHPRDDKDRLYVSRKVGWSELTNIEDGVKATILGLEEQTKNPKERQITAANTSKISIRTNTKQV